MIEYAILIVMVIFAIGFAWLWFIEQKKKRKRKEALQRRRRSSDSARARTFERHCSAGRCCSETSDIIVHSRKADICRQHLEVALCANLQQNVSWSLNS